MKIGGFARSVPRRIGCPVIASISGSSLVLIVSEPPLSGRHDLRRVGELTRHFGVPATVSVNKRRSRGSLRLDHSRVASTAARMDGAMTGEMLNER